MLPSEIPRLTTDPLVRLFPGVWKPLFFKTPFPGLSSSSDQVLGEQSHCDSSPSPSLLLSFLGVQLAHFLRWMLTVQNPKKSWLARKPAYSLVDNASLGPRLPLLVLAACHWKGMVYSWLTLLSPLFCERAWRCLRLGLFV